MVRYVYQLARQQTLQLELEEARKRGQEELASIHEKLDSEIASKNDAISTFSCLHSCSDAQFE